MSVSSGISIIQNKRIELFRQKFAEKGLVRLFTQYELEYSLQKSNWAQHLGCRFAAKCAFFHAMKWDKWYDYMSVSIEHGTLGAPCMILSGQIDGFFRNSEYSAIHISMSHIKEYSIANILLT
ncbi:MAG: hypothetical protein H7A34_05535 [bacterium]|nr:hypothetical protein [bacterium]